MSLSLADLAKNQPPHRTAVLSICLDLQRTLKREQALSSAGFRVVSATTVEAALAMSCYYEFSVIVLDEECCAPLPRLNLERPYTIVRSPAYNDENLLIEHLIALCDTDQRLATKQAA